jgi:hypothetical protein
MWLQVLVMGLLVSAQCGPSMTPGQKLTICRFHASKYKNWAHRLADCSHGVVRLHLQLRGGMEDDSLEDTQGMTDHASEGADGEYCDNLVLTCSLILCVFSFGGVRVFVCVCV